MILRLERVFCFFLVEEFIFSVVFLGGAGFRVGFLFFFFRFSVYSLSWWWEEVLREWRW